MKTLASTFAAIALAAGASAMDGGTVRIRSKNRSTNWKKSVRGVLHTQRIESQGGRGGLRETHARVRRLKRAVLRPQ